MLRDASPGGRRSVSALSPGMYAPAKPIPASPQIAVADHRPCANNANDSVARPVAAEPTSRMRRASMRSVSVVSSGTASM